MTVTATATTAMATRDTGARETRPHAKSAVSVDGRETLIEKLFGRPIARHNSRDSGRHTYINYARPARIRAISGARRRGRTHLISSGGAARRQSTRAVCGRRARDARPRHSTSGRPNGDYFSETSPTDPVSVARGDRPNVRPSVRTEMASKNSPERGTKTDGNRR